MKKQIVAMLMVVAFAFSATACAKGTNENIEEKAVEEASVGASEEIEAAVEEASEEASAEASEETSAEVSEEIGIVESLDDIDPNKVYKNDEFGVAVVIDDDMTFAGESELGDGGDSFGANSDNPMLEMFSYYNSVFVARAESNNNTRMVEISVADLSDKMTHSEAAYALVASTRRKVELEKDFDSVETKTEEIEIMGATHSVVRVEVTKDGNKVCMTDLYLIKDGRIMIISVYYVDKADCDKILGNLKRFK